MDCEEGTSRLCNDCVYSLIDYGILPSSVKSYILTNTEKDLLIKNYNRFVRRSSGLDLEEIKKCVKILSKENKCHDCNFNITGFSALRRRKFEDRSLDSVEEDDESEISGEEIVYYDSVPRREAPETINPNLPDGVLESLVRNMEYPDIVSLMRTDKNLNRRINQQHYKEIIEEKKIEGLKQVQSWLRGLGEDYSLEQLENVRELDIIDRGLKEIPRVLRNLPSLQRLDLNYNQITKLENLDSLPENLQRLYLYNNQITKLENLDSLPENLQILVLQSNQIKKLENLDALPENLQQLDLEGNRITKLENLDSLPENLRRLDLEGNQITKLENLDSLPENLQRLDLYNNQITKLENLDSLPENLQLLHLKGNQIEDSEDNRNYINYLREQYTNLQIEY